MSVGSYHGYGIASAERRQYLDSILPISYSIDSKYIQVERVMTISEGYYPVY